MLKITFNITNFDMNILYIFLVNQWFKEMIQNYEQDKIDFLRN